MTVFFLASQIKALRPVRATNALKRFTTDLGEATA